MYIVDAPSGPKLARTFKDAQKIAETEADAVRRSVCFYRLLMDGEGYVTSPKKESTDAEVP